MDQSLSLQTLLDGVRFLDDICFFLWREELDLRPPACRKLSM